MDNLGRDITIGFYVGMGVAALLGCAVGAIIVWLVNR